MEFSRVSSTSGVVEADPPADKHHLSGPVPSLCALTAKHGSRNRQNAAKNELPLRRHPGNRSSLGSSSKSALIRPRLKIKALSNHPAPIYCHPPRSIQFSDT